MPAALEGAAGKLQGIGCRVWSSNLYLHAHTALGLNPMAQAACNDFNKKMYRLGPGVSTGFCALHQVKHHKQGPLRVQQMQYAEYFHRVEKSITDVIRRCHPTSWDENHITFSLCDELFRQHHPVNLEGLDRPFKIIWDVRKLRRPEETDYGDIGVLVKLTTWANETLEGVGLLEAKRRDLGKGNFSSAKTSQLRRIVSKAPSAQLLLYDYENVSSCMDNWSVQFEDHYYRRRYGEVLPFTHCVCLPARVALQQGKYTTDLHKFGVPLSYQIVGRFFRGFDLETDANIVAGVKGNIGRNGGPRILILVGVSTGTQEPRLPEVNGNRYGPADDA